MRVYKNFINSDWVDAKSGDTFPVDNPATEEDFAEVSRSGTRDIDAAVVAAGLAFNGWRLTDPGSRREILKEIAKKTVEHGDEVEKLIHRSAGNRL